MPQFPKFLAARLARQQTQPAVHPDANTLSAFAEQRLNAANRKQVLSHLAICTDCRDVIALLAGDSPLKKSTFSSLPLRWTAALAASILVAVTVFWRPAAPVHIVPKQNPLVASSPIALSAPTPAKVGIAPSPLAAKKAGLATPLSVPVAPPAAPVVLAPPEFVVPNPVEPPKQFAKDLTPEPFPTDQTSTTQPQATQSLQPPTPTVALPGSQNQFFPPAPTPMHPVVGAFHRNAFAMAKASPTLQNRSLWSVDASPGTLHRSEDAGKTWQSVNVDGKTGFLAVFVSGSDIWTGGEAGALFHSTDNGNHWEEVTVQNGVDRLTLPITAIDARSTNLVRVKTNIGGWISFDGGRTWRRE
jgi:hypothetical protein